MPNFDILIQSDGESPIVRGCSEKGEAYVNHISRNIPEGHLVTLAMSPEEFVAEIPKDLIVGLVDPETQKIKLIGRPPLH